MNYGELVSRALRITWENRYLWFFGFFVGSGFSPPSFNFQYSSDFGDSKAFAADFGTVSSLGPVEIGLVAGAVLVLFVALILLALISQGGLADSVAAIDRGEARSFGSTWRAGRANIWHVFKVGVLIFLIALAGLILIGVPLGGITFAVFTSTEDLVARIVTGVTAGLLAIVALIVLGSLVSIVNQFAVRRIVLEGGGARDAIRFGYRLFRSRVGTSLLVFLLAIAIAIGALLALFIAAALVGLVLGLPAIGLLIAGLQTAAIVAGGVALLILLPLMLAAAGAVGTFGHAYWTLAYLRLTARAPAPPSVPAVP